jgi:hypothetical protein
LASRHQTCRPRKIRTSRKGEPIKFSSKFILAVSLTAFAVALTAQAAPPPERHPAYLHALSDLPDARAHLERPDGGELHQQEKDAVSEIDRAIGEIKKASIDDGKDLSDHVPVDAHLPWNGRLHKALDLLDKAHNDIAKEQDDPAALGLQQHAIEHIDKAHRHLQEAIMVVQ